MPRFSLRTALDDIDALPDDEIAELLAPFEPVDESAWRPWNPADYALPEGEAAP